MSNPSIQKVAVIGAGYRGSQIASHLANGGVPVLWLDLPPVEGEPSKAQKAWEDLLNDVPGLLTARRNAQMISTGDTDADLGRLAEVDWIIEAIEEDLTAKAVLYDKVDEVRKKGSVVSTVSTSFAWAALTEGREHALRQDFVVTHFSLPMRTTRLTSIVSGHETREGLIDRVADFCDRRMGKTVVNCRDTPGLITERLGLFYIQTVIDATHEFGLKVEEADCLSRRIGKGVYKSLDEVGIDKWLASSSQLASDLPSNDGFCKLYHQPPLFPQMVRAGYTGEKGKGGFYRSRPTSDGLVFETLNLQTGAYEPQRDRMAFASGLAGKKLRSLMESGEPAGLMLWRVLSQTLSYAVSISAQIADHISAIDQSMRFGFGWRLGPFELIDKVGVDWFMAQLRENGMPIPAFLLKAAGRSFYRSSEGCLEYLTAQGDYVRVKRPAGLLLLEDVQCQGEPVAYNQDARVWDIGDGVLCFTFQTKANSLTPDLLSLLDETLDAAAAKDDQGKNVWKGLVIYNESGSFSAGVNLQIILDAMQHKEWTFLESFVQKGRKVFRKMRHASFPTVVAVKGDAVGGGCEMLLHASAVQAYAECQIGLVESKIGLVPGWDGCLQLMGRVTAARKQFGGDVPPVNRVFENVVEGKVSRSAAEAVDLFYLRPSDGITMNEERLLHDAKQRVIEMSANYRPPEPWALSFTGAVGRAALDLAVEGYKLANDFSSHDLAVSKVLATVLCGGEGDPVGPITEDQMIDVTHREFMKLAQNAHTQARITYFLKTGQKLKN